MSAGRGVVSRGAAARRVDVVVIGDGPAGSALARACSTLGLDAVLIGPDEAWTPTYATWVDDLRPIIDQQDLGALLASSSPTISVYADHRMELPRAYGVLDNHALRRYLRDGVDHRHGRVDGVTRSDAPTRRESFRVDLDDGSEIAAAVVVDGAGWPARFAHRATTTAPAWQTAFGVVLAEPPNGDLGRATLMDFRPVVARGRESPSTVGPEGVVTFCYSVPVVDGWLVEETVLASRRPVEPVALLPRLAARLGRHPDALLSDARRTEYVRIPMGPPVAGTDGGVVAFGSAAGYVHPATGFSVATSLRAAPRVAMAIAEVVARGSVSAADREEIVRSVWPPQMLRTRALHRYGLEVLLGLDADEVCNFFGLFFERPVEEWAGYLRIDTPPTAVAATMLRMFSSAPWPMRRRLMGANPRALTQLIRP